MNNFNNKIFDNSNQFGNVLNKENKNYNNYSNKNGDINNNENNKTLNIQAEQNNTKGICTNKKNFSSITLTHNNIPDNNQTNNYEIKTRNNTKTDITSSSSYGAYYNFRK